MFLRAILVDRSDIFGIGVRSQESNTTTMVPIGIHKIIEVEAEVKVRWGSLVIRILLQGLFGNAATVTPHETHACSIDHSKAQFVLCVCCIPVVAGSCSRECVNLPIYDRFVNDIPVKVLRDTGCTRVIVRRALVGKNDP